MGWVWVGRAVSGGAGEELDLWKKLGCAGLCRVGGLGTCGWHVDVGVFGGVLFFAGSWNLGFWVYILW